MKKIILLSIAFAGILAAQAQPPKTIHVPAAKTTLKKPVAAPAEKERLVEISTPYGKMIARLYNATPLHRDNFIKLVSSGFYDSLLFHRVISGFMIQGGDPESKNSPPGASLGNGQAPGGGRIPAEFRPWIIHKKGALAAAREDNPEKASHNCQFYIVQGKTLDSAALVQVYEQRVKPATGASFQYTPGQREIYKRIGGAPHLDQSYTVFGEIFSGMDVIDKIAAQPVDQNSRPLKNVTMTIRMLN
jgi:peptidyl-prolyl cis-trans isomerase B (cyclophilin B)